MNGCLNVSRLKVFLLSLVLFPLLAAPAAAALKDVGPVDPANGFPVWYRDLTTNITAGGKIYTQGLPLEICLSQTESPAGGTGTYMCNLLPEPADGPPFTFDPANEIVCPTHFPSEAFWWVGEAIIDNPRYQGLLVLALEAAFAAEEPVDGDQVSFGRVRIRIDIPEFGNYRITHPYGVNTFFNVPAGTRTINHTSDIGIGASGDFTGALNSAIGPFLIWDTDFPVAVGDELFVGDPNVEHTVTGSPFGTNFFRIERLDADGEVLETVETDLFSITGKIYTNPIPGRLNVPRATYSRNAGGAQIDVFATSSVISNVDTPSSLVVKVPFFAPIPMRTADNEAHVAHLTADPAAVPATLQVINVADIPPTRRSRAVTDLVTITEASYDPGAQVLTIQAVSSDESVPPVLTTEFGDLTAGLLVVSDVAITPRKVQVISSAGGQDTDDVVIVVSPAAVDGSIEGFSPNGGETLVSGTTFTVSWPAVNGAQNYRLQYSTDNGATWQLVDVVASPTTTYGWTIPAVAVPAPTSLFRVVARSGGNNIGFSRSREVFTIAPAP